MLYRLTTLSYFYAGLFFIFSSKFWFSEILDLDLTLLAYIFFSLAFVFNFLAIKSFLLSLIKNPFMFEGLIILIPIISSFFLGTLNLELISFLGPYILFRSISDSNHNENENHILMMNGILLAALLTSIGVICGLMEVLVSDTVFLVTVVPEGYPNFLLSAVKNIINGEQIYQFSGFQFSVNYTAYTLIAGFLMADLLKPPKKIEYFIKALIIISLVLSQAKVIYVFLASLFLARYFKSYFIFSFLLLSAGYLFMTHIISAPQDEILIESKYIHNLIFSLGEHNYFLNLFAWLKIEAFNFYSIYGPNLNTYILLTGFEPHSLLISLLLISGLPLAVLAFFYLVYLCYKFSKSVLKDSYVYKAVFYTLILETFVWDSYDSPIFWAIIFLFLNSKLYMKDVSRIPSLS